jgi:adenosylcobinamide hydrolase
MIVDGFENGTGPLAGITSEHVTSDQGAYLLWKSDQPLRTLNSSPWGGGFGHHSCLINRQVHKDYDAEDPIEEMNRFLLLEGLLPDETAGMLTAAWIKDAGFYSSVGDNEASKEQDHLVVSACATVGLSNKARAGNVLPFESLYPGTINIIVFINGTLTDAAMVNAVITATEAKAAALTDLGIMVEAEGISRSATGTTTDAVLIATTERGSIHHYAGTATRVGYSIGRAVYEAVMAAGKRNVK